MAIGVKIDFGDVYDLVSDECRTATFKTQLQDGQSTTLLIEISDTPHVLLPNVYNLAFGPADSHGKINDRAEVHHADYSRVFSTILLKAFDYLSEHPDHYIGIDGSDNNRAYYYWRFLQRNFDYLSKYFDIYGLKYYVRITRCGKQQYDDPFDFGDIRIDFDRIFKTNVWPTQMYNYFAFEKKPQG